MRGPCCRTGLVLLSLVLSLECEGVRTETIECEIWEITDTHDTPADRDDDLVGHRDPHGAFQRVPKRDKPPYVCYSPTEKNSFVLRFPPGDHRIKDLGVEGGELLSLYDVEIENRRRNMINVDTNSELKVASRARSKGDRRIRRARQWSQQRATENFRALQGIGDAFEKRLLILRIICPDDAPTLDAGLIATRVFGPEPDDDLNAAGLIDECSRGQLKYVPATGVPSAVNGVREVEISLHADRGDYTGLEFWEHGNDLCNAAQAVMAQQDGVDPREAADYILCVIPPAAEPFTAFAFLGGWVSVYHDIWIQGPSVVLHELGHHAGHGHSGTPTSQSRDYTGAMGPGYTYQDQPSRCFNALFTWHYGWYVDRTFVMHSILDLPWTGKLVGFSEYGLIEDSPDDEYYVSWVFIHEYSVHQERDNGDDVFVSFNRATGPNFETNWDLKDKVLVLTGPAVTNGDAIRQAKLSEGESFFLANFTAAKLDLEVRVLRIDVLPTNGMAFAEVEIGVDLPPVSPEGPEPFEFRVVDNTAECRSTSKNLGTKFATAEDAARAAYADPECTGDLVMFSRYSYAWGAPCCAKWALGSTYDDNIVEHNNWGVFQFRGEPIVKRGLQHETLPALFAAGHRCDAEPSFAVHAKTPLACAEAAFVDALCTGDSVMWAAHSGEVKENCRCCRAPPSGAPLVTTTADPRWSVYRFRSPAGAQQRREAAERRTAAQRSSLRRRLSTSES